jgi:hypothetical protein
MSVYSKEPDFTFCFQYTILIWIPCLILWIISPIWFYMISQQTISQKIKLSWIFILKNVNDPYFFLLLLNLTYFNLTFNKYPVN